MLREDQRAATQRGRRFATIYGLDHFWPLGQTFARVNLQLVVDKHSRWRRTIGGKCHARMRPKVPIDLISKILI